MTLNLSVKDIDGNILAEGGHAFGDKVKNVEFIIGSSHSDILTGDEQENYIEGSGGADTIDGGTGDDTASYDSSDEGVSVDLSQTDEQGYSLGYGGHAEGDRLINIENLRGSDYADVLIVGDIGANISSYDGNDYLIGGAGDDRLIGGNGDDILEGGAGANWLEGGAGIDLVSYARSDAAVNVYLVAGNTHGGYATGDTLFHIENLTGSAFDDVLSGDGKDNAFFGGAGSDNLSGRGGSDMLEGGAGADIRMVVRVWILPFMPVLMREL